MIRHPQTSRADYEAIQRARTEAKWTLNGVTREEVIWYRDNLPSAPAEGPILCLGVRNGREVDLFRTLFTEHYETDLPAGELRYVPEVQGVELHPDGARPDVWVGSFDAMPAEWAGRFRLLYSNALDHAYDPEATAREWRRVAAPGAWLALSIHEGAEPTETDPIGDITHADIEAWFPGVDFRGAVERANRVHWQLWRLP